MVGLLLFDFLFVFFGDHRFVWFHTIGSDEACSYPSFGLTCLPVHVSTVDGSIGPSLPPRQPQRGALLSPFSPSLHNLNVHRPHRQSEPGCLQLSSRFTLHTALSLHLCFTAQRNRVLPKSTALARQSSGTRPGEPPPCQRPPELLTLRKADECARGLTDASQISIGALPEIGIGARARQVSGPPADLWGLAGGVLLRRCPLEPAYPWPGPPPA
ncbi:unnamed protein product [Lota lota]